MENQEEKFEGHAQSIRSLQSTNDKGVEKLRQDMEVRLNGQKTKTEEQAKSILSLHSANQMLRQEMNNSISILNTRPNAQQYQLLLQVNVADLMANGSVMKYSERKPVGAYNVQMTVDKGSPQNEDTCGVYLSLLSGPFPCQVSSIFEVVHWDGKPESACKHAFTCTYEKAKTWGISKFFPVSKLTAKASPYVNSGTFINGTISHITFIATFRIHSL